MTLTYTQAAAAMTLALIALALAQALAIAAVALWLDARARRRAAAADAAAHAWQAEIRARIDRIETHIHDTLRADDMHTAAGAISDAARTLRGIGGLVGIVEAPAGPYGD